LGNLQTEQIKNFFTWFSAIRIKVSLMGTGLENGLQAGADPNNLTEVKMFQQRTVV
jgi:hypothetical protein